MSTRSQRPRLGALDDRRGVRLGLAHAHPPAGRPVRPHRPGHFWGVGSDLGPTGDWTSWKTSAPATAGQWQCVEFHLDSPT
ncbi:hypothetical protein STVIR_3292 [Streptomyces viridochromogenes Tue57]|uniref:Uncharacterized protein n=1 Tax=Streptomyces viridochromogenes Tue57 TaxID=1160705 RepID=L8PHQ4_STRVR|nr:hypothetical protein STVIR_3292 [Streptomyces viridochromogenes Tue57]